MRQFFLDTGFIIALEDKNDQYHPQARKFWKNLDRTSQIVTSSFILDEVTTAFNRRNLHSKAVEIGEKLLYSSDISFYQVGENLLFDSWDYFKKHDDKAYSLTDCVSFVLMKQLKIDRALALDKHFEQAGFQCLPNDS